MRRTLIGAGIPRSRLAGSLLAGSLLAVLLLAGPAAAERTDERSPGSPDRAELREALGDFYIQVVGEELGLDEQQLVELEPRMREVLSAQKSAGRERRAALKDLVRLRDEGADDGSLEQAVSAYLTEEREREAAIVEARRAVVDQLTARQAARYLTFASDRFRSRVGELMERPARRGEPRDRNMAERDGGRDRRRLDGPPGRGRRGDRMRMRDGARSRSDNPGGDATDSRRARRREEASELLLLLFAHRLQQRFELTRAETLDWLPVLEDAIRTRLDLRAELRQHARQLQAVADDDRLADDDVRTAVDEALDSAARAPERMQDARSPILERLTPRQAVDYLELEARFEHEKGRRLRALERMLSGGRGGKRRGR